MVTTSVRMPRAQSTRAGKATCQGLVSPEYGWTRPAHGHHARAPPARPTTSRPACPGTEDTGKDGSSKDDGLVLEGVGQRPQPTAENYSYLRSFALRALTNYPRAGLDLVEEVHVRPIVCGARAIPTFQLPRRRLGAASNAASASSTNAPAGAEKQPQPAPWAEGCSEPPSTLGIPESARPRRSGFQRPCSRHPCHCPGHRRSQQLPA